MRQFVCAAMLSALAGPLSADDLTNGRESYERLCAACHGIEATGNGPMQPVLLVTPTNLTQLSAQNSGEFPLLRVIKRIDGRDPLVAHGSQMPVYGDYFEGEDLTINTPAGQPIMTSRPVVELVVYLKSLQTGLD